MSGREEFLAGVWEKAAQKEQTLRAAKVMLSETAEPDFAGFIRNMFVNIGVKQLYTGMGGIISIAFVMTVLSAYLLLQIILDKGESIYAAAFCSAPFLYAGIFVLSWLQERGSGSYELQMSCKYTFFHVLAARMLGNVSWVLFLTVCMRLRWLCGIGRTAYGCLQFSSALLCCFPCCLPQGCCGAGESGGRCAAVQGGFWQIFFSCFLYRGFTGGCCRSFRCFYLSGWAYAACACM